MAGESVPKVIEESTAKMWVLPGIGLSIWRTMRSPSVCNSKWVLEPCWRGKVREAKGGSWTLKLVLQMGWKGSPGREYSPPEE